MKIALYSPYLNTLGGGERYLATIAEGLLKSGNEVVFFWDDRKIVKKLIDRFNLDLKKVKVSPNVFEKGNLINKYLQLYSFDVGIYLSDGSIPTPFAKKNILHFQVPFKLKNGKSLVNRLKLLKYTAVVCNSKFTKKYIDRTFGIDSKVIYPPVDIDLFKQKSNIKKENIILSVGRFTSVFGGKKQDVLIEAFRSFTRNHKSLTNGWQLFLAGGVGDQKYFNNLQSIARDLPVKFFPDVSLPKLNELYTKAKIYWHATGFGEDLKIHPEKAEHFGIAVVEAASAGCVPIVFNAGGLTETVKDGKNGYLWKTKSELANKTIKIINDYKIEKDIANNAKENAKKFSKQKFISEFFNLIN